MRNKLLIYSSCLLILGFYGCKGEKSPADFAESSNTIEQDTSEFAEIKKAALSFHKWYMASVDNPKNSNWSVDVVEDSNGYCAFDFYSYFDALRKLGTISEKFLESERQRLRFCEDFLKTVKYVDFNSSEEAYVYQDDCPSFYHMYWIRSQEPFTGVEIDEVVENQGVWKATLVFYNDFQGKKEYFKSNQPIITLSQENTTWKIVTIDWKN